MKAVSVIGAGTMGNGIAHVFALNGFPVRMADISPDALEKALLAIQGNLDRMIKKELIGEPEKARALANITTFTDLEQAVSGADLVIEAATEQEGLKENLLGSGSPGARRMHSGNQHVIDFHYGYCCGDQTAG